MKTIWKFPIPIKDNIEVQMPAGAKILSVGAQNDMSQIWAEVDDVMPKDYRRFKLRGTGHELTGEEGQFIGSFQMYGGELIFHLYEAAQWLK